MASDRTLYDEGAFQVKTKESVKPLAWVLDLNAHETCNTCGDKPNVSKHEERVDVENDLLGINRKLSQDPSQKYQKSDTIATQLNYAPAYMCERNIVDTTFLDQNATWGNTYMEKLRYLSPSDILLPEQSENMRKLVNFSEKL
jgi:hypothetical protein